VRALIETLKTKLSLDEKRIYAAGVSNGGFFSHRIACESADIFAAVGVVAAAIPTKLAPKCAQGEPISIIAIQGTRDPGVPINGGEMTGILGILGHGGIVESARSTREFWASKNGCESSPAVSPLPRLVEDGTSVTEYTYQTCNGKTAVHYYIVEGMGHGWPPKRPQAPRVSGPTSHNINATEIIWEFFKTHPKQNESSYD
jgi:polyhydroxybutyrate depolymerase